MTRVAQPPLRIVNGARAPYQQRAGSILDRTRATS
jgi:hypothetical protein